MESGLEPEKDAPMPLVMQAAVKNGLLKVLPGESFSRLQPYLQTVDLPLKRVLVEAEVRTADVVFIEGGLASMVATFDANRDEQVEIGHIGSEGLAGMHVALDVECTPNRTFMQIEGSGFSVPAAVLVAAMDEDRRLRRLILQYIQVYQIQMAQTALAASRQTTHRRLARWLLMCHDRTVGDDLPLTHDLIALTLGVRRAGVTNEMHILEGLRAIRSTRGMVHVRDRQRLEEVAGPSYGLPERQYKELIGGIARLN